MQNLRIGIGAEQPLHDEDLSGSSNVYSERVCSSDPAATFFIRADLLLSYPESWVEITAASLDRKAASGFEVLDNRPVDSYSDMGAASAGLALAGQPPERIIMPNLEADLLQQESDAGVGDFLLGFGNGRVTIVVSLRPNGEIALLGDCLQYQTTEIVAAHALIAEGVGTATNYPTQAEFLRGIAQGDGVAMSAFTAALDTLLSPGRAWVDKDPDLRGLRPSEMPKEILASLEDFTVIVEVPVEWTDRSEAVCTRTSLGWNPCMHLRYGPTLEFNGMWFVPGESLEVMLVSEDLAWPPLATLGSIPAERLTAYQDGEPVIVTVIATTVDDAIKAANDGESVIEVD